MDPTNPRWETRENRRAKSATLWKIIAGAAGASALTAMVVASCLDRDAVARRTTIVDEPAYVQTTAAPAPAAAPLPGTPTTPTISDSTGGINERPSTTQTTGGAVVVPSGATTINITNVTSPAANDTSSGVQAGGAPIGAAQAPSTAPPQANTNTTPPTPTTSPTTTQSPTTRAGGSNPDAPTLSAGAGPFATEAPYWTSSAWVSNPDAGAGQFSTERNSPAR